MRKILLLIIALPLLASCAGKDYSKAETLVYSNIKIFYEDGQDRTKRCNPLTKDGLFMQEVVAGENQMTTITCHTGIYLLRLNTDSFTVDIPKSGKAYYLGDFEIRFSGEKGYQIQRISTKSAGLYKGPLKRAKAKLNIGDGPKFYKKIKIGGTY